MRWLLLGALAGLLLACPQLLALVLAAATAILSKPVLAAFGLGLATRLSLPHGWRRTR
ncbi:hypothetical protein AB0F46_29485 [Streptomyces sp. NPDC026665]|uniref:hypothetical protein n=1 Tax=Streptomyces sp. NPDC026665 TaxID=3154798 RepID=UPI0033FAC0F2